MQLKDPILSEEELRTLLPFLIVSSEEERKARSQYQKLVLELGKPSVAPQRLKLHADTPYYDVASCLLSNEHTPVDVITHLFKRIWAEQHRIRAQAFSNHRSPTHNRTDMKAHHYRYLEALVGLIPRNPNTSSEVLHVISRESNWGLIYVSLAANPKTPLVELGRLERETLSVLDNFSSHDHRLEQLIYRTLWHNPTFLASKASEIPEIEEVASLLSATELIELLAPQGFLTLLRADM